MSFDGFVKSHRAKWENPIFRNLLEAAIWGWMCETAAWKETRIRFNGELVTVRRGQLMTSRGFIAKGFCIGEQVIRTFLDHIESDGMINQQATRRGTLITICNYEKYQTNETEDNQQTNQPITSHQPATNHNKKELKNLRTEEKKDTPPGVSDEAWLEYLKVRKKKRAAQTDYAISLVHAEIEKLKEQGFSPQELVEQSVRNSWIDIFPIREKKQNATHIQHTAKPSWKSEADRLKAEFIAEAELEAQALHDGAAGENLCLTEAIWEDTSGAGRIG